MAKATPYDPKVSSVVKVQYCAPTSTSRAFIYPYDGTTLLELSPKGATCEPGTLDDTAPYAGAWA
jgi:hypothetical protein